MNQKTPGPAVTSSQIDRTLQMLWSMYVVSSAIFVGVGYLLIEQGTAQVAGKSQPGWLGAVALALILSFVAIRLARKASTIEDARKRLTMSLVALSVAELIVIGGIVAGVVLKSHYPLLLLAGFSLALFFRLSSALR